MWLIKYYSSHELVHVCTSTTQRERLLDSTGRLDKTSNQLEEGHRIALETEQIGMDIMDNLQKDRETIQRARSRVSITPLHVLPTARMQCPSNKSLVDDE